MKWIVFGSMVLTACVSVDEPVGSHQQAILADDLVRRTYDPDITGDFGEGLMIQVQRGSVAVPGTLWPNNEIVVTMNGLGGTLDVLDVPFDSPETPVYRFVLPVAKTRTVVLENDSVAFATCIAGTVGWLDAQWTGFKYVVTGWGGGCGPAPGGMQ